MNPSPSITETISTMFSQSLQVLTKPSVATFEQYEAKGSLREALIYVLLFAVIGALGSLGGGVTAFLNSIIGTVAGFLVFVYLVHTIGKSQGGTGSLDHVAYTFALFWGPLSVLLGIATLILIITLIGILLLPLLFLAFLAVNIYFGYLAVQSSMNLTESGKIWITLIGAAAGSFLVSIVIGAILG
ncbi:YIP1 family protein [Calidithermus chliarophilus]|uniref:YIP1 family protein n=1 Tax=Calidithermus chliarophilus TaxID=52023 RepID=UPI00040AA520|nr:YIP1 family protein [Calidithermus chliarophilus]